jgi:hypothetical protein
MLSSFLEYYWGAAPITISVELEQAVQQSPRIFLVTGPETEIEAYFADYGPPTQELQFGTLRLLVFEASNS